jgi:hypothetical protein
MAGEQLHGLIGSPYHPHGHGFCAATSMKFAGKVSVPAARLCVICPLCLTGWLLGVRLLGWGIGGCLGAGLVKSGVGKDEDSCLTRISLVDLN